MDVQEAVFISPLPGGAWDNRKVGSVWEEPPAGGLPRTTPNLNILMARVSAMTKFNNYIVTALKYQAKCKMNGCIFIDNDDNVDNFCLLWLV